MHPYIYETNFFVDFVSNKNQRGREKNNNTRKTSWAAHGHKLAALMKKRKEEEILCNKEQSAVQSTEQYSVQSTEQSTVQSNDTYVFSVGILVALAIGVCVFFAYNASQAKNKEPVNEKGQPSKRRHMLQKNIQ